MIGLRVLPREPSVVSEIDRLVGELFNLGMPTRDFAERAILIRRPHQSFLLSDGRAHDH
jgi:hypothetical protein